MRRPVVDSQAQEAGTLECIWIDPSTHRAEFVGIKTGFGLATAHVVPARAVDEDHGRIKLRHAVEFLQNGPAFAPQAELAEIEKQEINAYYGHFVPIRRTSAIEQLRPEEKVEADRSAAHEEASRGDIEREEQGFFKQKGFVTDSMREVDRSKDLKRTAQETKIREDEHERRHGG